MPSRVISIPTSGTSQLVLTATSSVPQLMKPEDVAAYQKREISVETLMQNYYPTKLQKKVTPEEFKADNKLSDGRVIDRMVIYKEHDESRDDVGKYKIYTQVGNQKDERARCRMRISMPTLTV
jgi:ubiquitin